MATSYCDQVSVDVLIRPVEEGDLAAFFAFQLDAEANRMAAFAPPDPADRAAFDAHWARVLGDPDVTVRTVTAGGVVVGNVLSFPDADVTEVGYWIGRQYWGLGYATEALSALLREVTVRPLRARTAKDNVRSLAVLHKCGFRVTGEDRGFAEARGGEIEEYVLELRD